MGADRLDRIDGILPVIPGRADDPEAPFAFQRSLTSSLSKFVGTPTLIVLGGSARTLGNMKRPHHRRERREARGEEDPADHDPGEEQERPAIGLRGGDGGRLRRLGQGRLRPASFSRVADLAATAARAGVAPSPSAVRVAAAAAASLVFFAPVWRNASARSFGSVIFSSGGSVRGAAALAAAAAGLAPAGFAAAGVAAGRGASRPRGRQLLLQRHRPAERRGRGRHRGRGPRHPRSGSTRPPARSPTATEQPAAFATGAVGVPPARAAASFSFSVSGLPRAGGRRGRGRGWSFGREVRLHNSRRLALRWRRHLRHGRRGGTAARAAASFSFNVNGLPRLAGVGTSAAGAAGAAADSDASTGVGCGDSAGADSGAGASPSGFAGPARRAAAKMSFTLGRSAIGQLSLSQNRGPLGEGLYHGRS
jgi:hypothetical protein